MGDDLQRQALARDLARRQQNCSLDELRVQDRVLGRLELGRQRYGELDLSKPRNWQRERFEERLDALVYDVCDELVLEDAARAQLREEARREMVGERPTFGELVERECTAIHAAADAKERAMDTYGYGGPRAVAATSIMGIDPSLRASVLDDCRRQTEAEIEFATGQTTRIGGPDPYVSVEVKLDDIEGERG
jgi:hypothetical protein